MQIPFKKNNILIILAGVFLIVLGYLLMATENFIDASEFSLSLNVSPILIILGHVVVAVGIIFRTKKSTDADDTSAENVSKAS